MIFIVITDLVAFDVSHECPKLALAVASTEWWAGMQSKQTHDELKALSLV